MKKYLCLFQAAFLIAACSSVPPKPYGNAFPINNYPDHIQKVSHHAVQKENR